MRASNRPSRITPRRVSNSMLGWFRALRTRETTALRIDGSNSTSGIASGHGAILANLIVGRPVATTLLVGKGDLAPQKKLR